MMSSRALDRHVDELAEIAVRVLSLKGRLTVALPEDVAKLKRLLSRSRRARGTDLPAHCDLFFRVANLLAVRALTMGELSRALAVPLSTATRVIDWQVAHGYVERRPDPDDRRLVRVALTAAGRELFSRVQAVLKERIRRVAGAFTAEEREMLISLLRKLVIVLTENGTRNA